MVGALLVGAPYAVQAKEIKEVSSGESFPETVSFEADGTNYDLNITGTALRKKFIVKVYAVAGYVEKGAVVSGDKFEQIQNGDIAKQLTMKWLRGATVNQLQDGYRESFKSVFGDDAEMAKTIDEFVAFLNEPAKKGDVQVLRFIPGGIVEYELNGKKIGQIENEAFQKGLLSIWFGPNSVVNRDSLTSLIK